MTTRLSSSRIWQLSYGLSRRDLAVVATLGKVRVASMSQLQRLHYPGQARTARRSLAELSQRRIVTRLTRTVGGVRAGSAGQVYALDVVGQQLSEQGGPAGGARLRSPWTPGVRFLAHALAVSEIFVQLNESERRGAFELMEFQGEPECWRAFEPMGVPTLLKPDAFARLGFESHEDSFFLEVDRATESIRTLAIKAEAYRQYWDSGTEQHQRGVFPRVLWIVPDEARANVLKQVLGMGQDRGNEGNKGNGARGSHAVPVHGEKPEGLFAVTTSNRLEEAFFDGETAERSGQEPTLNGNGQTRNDNKPMNQTKGGEDE